MFYIFRLLSEFIISCHRPQHIHEQAVNNSMKYFSWNGGIPAWKRSVNYFTTTLVDQELLNCSASSSDDNQPVDHPFSGQPVNRSDSQSISHSANRSGRQFYQFLNFLFICETRNSQVFKRKIFVWLVLGVQSIATIFIPLFSFLYHYMFRPLQAILRWNIHSRFLKAITPTNI
jgi:hypothetical protein